MKRADPDVQHALAHALGEHLQVDPGANRTPCPAGPQDLEHRAVDRGGRLTRELDQLVTRDLRRVVERQDQGRPMAHGARGDCFAELDDAVLDRRRFEGVERVHGLLGDTLEVVAVALDELDDDRLLRVEVVVQAPRQDPARIGDLSE